MLKSSNLLYQAEQIRDLEKIAMQEGNLSVADLMQRAGLAAFRELQNHWPKSKHITVVCGKGNNAGDGYVLAQCAQHAKLKVMILQVVPIEKLTGAAKAAAEECAKLKIPMETFSADKLQQAEVIVDALLGTGLVGEVHTKFQEAINAINATKLPILALDLPSGLEANTGKVLGTAIQAQVTITFIGNKLGLFCGEARDHCGKILCDDLDIPPSIYHQVGSSAEILNFPELKTKLPPRKANANKGHFGHVLIIGGDYGMGGAVRMAAEAALRVGAGLVTVATRPSHVSAIIAACPEIMCHGINFWWQLSELVRKATVVVIGPGLGKSYWSKRLLFETLRYEKKMVVDADALNLLAGLSARFNEWVITPHPGEASRLLNLSVQQIQEDRVTAARALQHQLGGVCVLKGAGTLVAGSNELLGLCNAGNPGMASAGMGDILSGIIGGLMAQGLTLHDAANLGVCVHALAGDAVAKNNGQRGMVATDLLEFLQSLIN